MMPSRWQCLIFLTALAVILQSARAEAGVTLERVRQNSQLRCGVSEGLEGFSLKDGDGVWRGIDADFCRAVAAAVLGDPDRVRFVPLAPPARFAALKLDKIDLLSRNTTYTFNREVDLGLSFAGILYYDHQAVMVPKRSNIRRLRDLKGTSICVVKSSTHEINLADYFAERRWHYTPVVVNTLEEGKNAFFTGRCLAYTSDASQLTTIRLNAPKDFGQLVILPDILSKEPLGPVVTRGDEEWMTLVKWVLFALIEAEEQGISQANARFQYAENADSSVQALLGVTSTPGKAFGIGNDWVVRVVESVGNYGEMFERNVGRGSQLKIDRGLNRLWYRGGLMYSPPIR